MSEPICVRCARPLADGAYACDRCASQAAQKLAEIAETCPAARDVANGLSRRSQGGGSGKPGSRLPLDLTATSKLDGISATLTTWARHVSESRGIALPEPPIELPGALIGPLCRTRYECTHDSCKIMRDGDEWGWDAIEVSARFLGDHLEWWRHRDEADEFLTDVDACLRVVRGIARGPAEQRYLGPCGATLKFEGCIGRSDGLCLSMTDGGYRCDEGECVQARSTECDGDVYGRAGATTGSCRACGAQVDQGERRAWLDDEVRQRAFTAREIGDAYGINVKTIRSWHERGHLAQHGEDREGRPLHNVGDVLDLYVADKTRREEARAVRERRAAVRAEDERLSA